LLPGLRPLFAFGFSVVAVAVSGVVSGVEVVVMLGAGISSLNKGAGVGRGGVFASSFCALSFVAVYTLSPSFFTLMRERLRG
jgi:hypothetical protein